MTLEAAGDYYVATVEDNGKGGQGFFAIANRVGGFEEHPDLRDHFGLTIMRERAQKIGGQPRGRQPAAGRLPRAPVISAHPEASPA
jgi:signal transduction histidine kinase